MATLQLNLIKQWFDLTLQGIKKEEYRDITPYWTKRFLCMENGDSLTKCYSKETIECICISLKHWEDVDYASIEEVLDTVGNMMKSVNSISKDFSGKGGSFGGGGASGGW